MFVRIVDFMIMNKHMKLALAAVVAATFSQAAFAAGVYPTNNLAFGFNQSSAQSDYIINLGDAASTVGVGGSSVVDLSSDISSSVFNSIFTGGATGVGVAVVGGAPSTAPFDIYATQIRAGGAGNPSVPGSSLAGKSHSSTILATAAATLGSLAWPAPGTGTNDGSKSYTKQVGPTLTATDFYGKCGINPFGTFGSPAIIYLDLWYGTTASYAYVGYFTADLSTGTPHLTFTPAGAPFTAQPPAPILTITQSGITNIISFGTTNGATYNLLYNTLSGLTSPRSSWSPLGSSIIGTGGITNFTDTTVTPGRVYSVTAQ